MTDLPPATHVERTRGPAEVASPPVGRPGAGGARAVRICRFPGCTRPAKAPNPRGGRPPVYCSDPAHNKASRFALLYPGGTAAHPPATPPALTSSSPVLDEDDPLHDTLEDPTEAANPMASSEAAISQERIDELNWAAAQARRAERAEAVAEDRQAQLREAHSRAERREAQLLDRLMAAGDEIAALRSELAVLHEHTPTPPLVGVPDPRHHPPATGGSSSGEPGPGPS